MAKSIPPAHRPVGPRLQLAFGNELPALRQDLTHRLNFLLRTSHPRGHTRNGKFRPSHTSHLQHLLLLRRELLHLHFQQLA
jgi:hypothetical protein